MKKNMQANNDIGENIRLYRIKAGFTHQELAEEIASAGGICPGETIKIYEEGKLAVRAVDLSYIASVLGVDVANFFEPPHPAILLDKQAINLLELFHLLPLNQKTALFGFLHNFV